MIKRDKRNIGRIIKVNSPDSNSGFHGRFGKVVGFRGDYEEGDPYVEVFIYDLHKICHLKMTGSIYPFAGHLLEKV